MSNFTEVKRHKDNYEVNVFDEKTHRRKTKSYYRTIIDRNPERLAQFFLDLYLDGFPVSVAFKIMQERIEKKDWLGF